MSLPLQLLSSVLFLSLLLLSYNPLFFTVYITFFLHKCMCKNYSVGITYNVTRNVLYRLGQHCRLRDIVCEYHTVILCSKGYLRSMYRVSLNVSVIRLKLGASDATCCYHRIQCSCNHVSSWCNPTFPKA